LKAGFRPCFFYEYFCCMNYPWGHSRRYNAYAPYFKSLFGERVQKISVDAGFSCPNRDGTKARGGCTYCNNYAFNPSYCDPGKSIGLQVKEGIEFHRVRYRRANKYLVYFQPYSNTHEPLDRLKIHYNEALKQEDVIGLVISTRPDCVDEEKLDYLQLLSKEHFIAVEYGVESIYNQTLEKINRADTLEQAIKSIKMTSERGLHTGAHFIFGLPGESWQMMLKSVTTINKLPLSSIKFHQLQIVKGTYMEKDYSLHQDEYPLFSFTDYVDFIIQFVERLNPAFIIERFAVEVPPRFLAGPDWGLIRNDQVIQTIEDEMKIRDTWQGKYFDV